MLLRFVRFYRGRGKGETALQVKLNVPAQRELRFVYEYVYTEGQRDREREREIEYYVPLQRIAALIGAQLSCCGLRPVYPPPLPCCCLH